MQFYTRGAPPSTGTPAEVIVSTSAVTATTATIDYDLTINDDANVNVHVYPTGTTTGALVSQELTEEAGSIPVTGLTAETTYDIVIESDLIVEPMVIDQFETMPV